MKRILTIFCAIAFSGAAHSAQNNADTIKVSRNESDTLVIIVKESQSIDHQTRKEQRLAEKAQKPAYMINVGYEYQLGFWGHLDGKHMHNVKLGVAYTF